MAEHRATIRWQRESDEFTYDTYNREHRWEFDGGEVVRGSAAPGYKGDEDCVDPEEALVAALSSCHMLTFLAVAAKKRFVVDSYTDEAIGHVEKNADGKLAVTRVELHPHVEFSGAKQPTDDDLDQLHHAAHEHCFIANSVKTEVTVEPA
jgi:organic hydroperoxide reductase OsmC/OhrA